jgi:hypothetical protein
MGGGYVGHSEVEEGGKDLPREEFGMDCQGMSGRETEEEDVGGEDEDEGDHGWDAVGGFFPKMEKLKIDQQSDPKTRVHGVSGSRGGNYQT